MLKIIQKMSEKVMIFEIQIHELLSPQTTEVTPIGEGPEAEETAETSGDKGR